MESWIAFNQRLELANEREMASIESGVKSCSLPDILLTYFIYLSIFFFVLLQSHINRSKQWTGW